MSENLGRKRSGLHESATIDVTDTPQLLLDQTQALLEKWKHPDPYRPPTAPGGSKYERNLPCHILDRKSLPACRFYSSDTHSTAKDASVVFDSIAYPIMFSIQVAQQSNS